MTRLAALVGLAIAGCGDAVLPSVKTSALVGAAVDVTPVVGFGPVAYGKTIPAVASDGLDYLVVWSDYRAGTVLDFFPGSQGELLGARVSSTGAVLDLVSLPISFEVGRQTEPTLVWDGARYLVVWVDTRPGTTVSDLYATWVARDGTVGDLRGFPMSEAPGAQSSPRLARAGGALALAFSDRRDGGAIYAGVVSSEGRLAEFFVAPVLAASASPRVACQDSGRCVVTWVDRGQALSELNVAEVQLAAGAVSRGPIVVARSDAGLADVELQRHQATFALAWTQAPDDGGVLEQDVWEATLEPDTLAVSNVRLINGARGRQGWPALASTSAGLLGVWVDTGSRTALATLLPSVDPRSDGGVPVASSPALAAPVLATNGTTALLAWANSGSDFFQGSVQARLLNPAALSPHLDGGAWLSTSAPEQYLARVATDGQRFFVTWLESRDGLTASVWGRRFDAAGVPLDAPTELVAGLTRTGGGYQLVGSEAGFLVASYLLPDVRARVVSRDGVAAPMVPVASVTDGGSLRAYAAAASDAGFVVGWVETFSGVDTARWAEVRPTGAGPARALTSVRPSFTLNSFSLVPTGADVTALWLNGGALYALGLASGPDAGERLTADGGSLPSAALTVEGGRGLLTWTATTPDAGTDVRGVAWPLSEPVTRTSGDVVAGGPDTQSAHAVAFAGARAVLAVETQVRVDQTSIAVVPVGGTVEPVASVGNPRRPAMACVGRRCLVAFDVMRPERDVVARRVELRPLAVTEVPVVQPQRLSTPRDTPIDVTLLASDADADPLTFEARAPGTGSLSPVDAGMVRFQPASGFIGLDSFEVVASDPYGASASARIEIEVTAACRAEADCGAGERCHEGFCQAVPRYVVGCNCQAGSAGPLWLFAVTIGARYRGAAKRRENSQREGGR